MSIDTLLADAGKYARLIEPAFALVGIALSLTGVGGPGASTALGVLDAAVKSFEAGANGTKTSDEVLAELSALHANLLGDIAAARAELAARFPT